MDIATAKELLHIRDWMTRVALIVVEGRQEYLRNPLLQEAGDALMMKIGEAANRLSRRGVEAPVAWTDAIVNRNFLIHQYDDVNRLRTWQTLSRDLMTWQSRLQTLITAAEHRLESPRN